VFDGACYQKKPKHEASELPRRKKIHARGHELIAELALEVLNDGLPTA